MVVHDRSITITVDNDVIDMMIYCNDILGCPGSRCPYWKKCNNFENKYKTVPYDFYTEDGKLLTSLCKLRRNTPEGVSGYCSKSKYCKEVKTQTGNN